MSFGQLRHIDVSYDKKNLILEDLNLDIHQGELLSLLGPSGCGKTTTLRVIAGLIEASAGTFMLDGTDMTHVPVHKRDFGIVFQSYALFPHLTVFDNIAFGLKLRKIDSATIAKQVTKMVDICGITGLEGRFPKQLSGGQRQRVALARALVIEPKLLLLDEPLSNLDAQLRLQMRSSIKRIQQELGITTVFVTHDQEECFSISDRVAIMQKGKIEQCESPEKIYSNPATEMIARFVGFKNLFALEKAKEAGVSVPKDKLASKLFCIRGEDVKLDEKTEDSVLTGTIEVRTYLGKGYQYEVKTSLGLVTVASSQEPAFGVGSSVSVVFPKEKLLFLQS
jgi:putative spermidine/putrescine transport system ATP-binding protein